MKKISGSKYKLSPKEQKLCHGIIHSASGSAAAVGAGLAQLPLADNAVITPIQITMIISLGKVFEQSISKTVAQSLLGGFVANFVGRGVAQAAIGWVPAIGNVTNAVTAAAITESIGWLSVDYFYKTRYLDKSGDYVPKNEKELDESDSSDGKREQKEALKKLAEQFIRGEKSRHQDKEEYRQCLGEFDNLLYGLAETDSLHELYRKFMDVK